MTGIRFYLEYASTYKKRKNIHEGNVFAAFVCNGRNHLGGYDGIGAVLHLPDSPVASTGASQEYLRKYTKRISEEKARAIHPSLFARLDSSNETSKA